MNEDERIQQFCRAIASAMLHLDTAIAVPAIGLQMTKRGRQELEKASQLCPESIKEKIVAIYDHVKAKEDRRKANADLGE